VLLLQLVQRTAMLLLCVLALHTRSTMACTLVTSALASQQMTS
jgi:hypothetical protein